MAANSAGKIAASPDVPNADRRTLNIPNRNTARTEGRNSDGKSEETVDVVLADAVPDWAPRAESY